jgi:phospholipase/lecithinase/hemolysin
MRNATTICVLAAALVPFATATVPMAAQAPFERIVAFGTSLSDSGNAFALRGGTNTPPDYLVDPLLIPSAPYARGGHHFSNGATWIEQFARSTGLAGTVRPAFASSSQNATNFAVGGARAYEDGININLGAQVGAFLQQSGNSAAPDALYAIEFGGNDIRDALAAFVGGGNGTAVLEDAVLAIARNVQALHGAGARTFLIWRAPNVGITPAIRTLDKINPGAAYLASQLTRGFNAELDGAVTQLSALPGIRIVRLDAYRLLNDLVADPAAFGLTDVETACVTPNVPPFSCDGPDEFLFWDGIHPTKATHTIIAQDAAAELAR